MAVSFVLIIFPALVLANINVKVDGNFNGNASDVKINFHGKEVAPLIDAEINNFTQSNDDLKYAIEKYVLQHPVNAYIRSPASLPDLYKKYSFSNVTRTIRTRSGKITKISFEPVTIVLQSFENYSPKPVNSTIDILRYLYNTVSSSWNLQGEFSVSKNIYYDFDILWEDREFISFAYTSSWGQNTKQSQKVLFGSVSPMDFVLEPVQTIDVQLQVTRSTVQIEIEYEVALTGDIVVDCPERASRYLVLPLYYCMVPAHLPFEKLSREVIDIVVYMNPNVMIHEQSHQSKIENSGSM